MKWEEFLTLKSCESNLTEAERKVFLLRFSQENLNKYGQEWIQFLVEKKHFTEQNFKKKMTKVYQKFDDMYNSKILEYHKFKKLLGLLQQEYNQKYNKQETYAPKEENINYTELKKFLAAGGWRDADKETARVMYKATNYLTTGSLIVTDIQNFPKEVLCAIDQHWVQFSNNTFGFSVQSEIYINELEAKTDFDETIWNNFGTRIGWRDEIDWFPYEELQYSLKDNKKGHLPRLSAWNHNDERFFKNLFHALLWRVHDLNNT